MCTFLENAEAMCLHACIPPLWWEFAVEHSIHVYNRTPLAQHDWKTPYKIIYKEKPLVKHLRVFGHSAYVFVPEEDCKKKLQPKAKLMTYIGWGPSGHCFMNKDGSKCHVSNTKWDEYLFPCCKTPAPICCTVIVSDKHDGPPGNKPVEELDVDDIPVTVTPPSTKPAGAPHTSVLPPITPPALKTECACEPDPSRTPPALSTSRNGPSAPTISRTSSARPPSPAEFGLDSLLSKGPAKQSPMRVHTKAKQKQPAALQPPTRQSTCDQNPAVCPDNFLPDNPVAAERETLRDFNKRMKQAGAGCSIVPLQTQQPGMVPGLPVLPHTPDVPSSTRLWQSIQDCLKATVSPPMPPGTFSLTEVAKLQGVPTGTDDAADAPPSADPSNPLGPDMALICREGGKALMMLLLHVVHAEKSSKPVCEWTDCIVVKLPEAECAKWLGKDDAYAKELEALKQCDVFGPLVDLPPGHKAIDNRWVHDIKCDGHLKVCLVAKGFSQVKDIDYNQVFLPVVRFKTVRVMLALCALENWHIEGLNVCNAYLYGKLKEEIYMQQPKGFKVKGKEHMVIRLDCALYRLKQAGLVWYWTLAKSLKEMGLTPINSNASIYIYWCGDNFVIAIVYVDDGLFVGPNLALTCSVKDMVMKKWDCHNLGESSEFIGITFTRRDGKIYLDQRDYLKKVIEHCGMQNAKLVPTPLPAGYVPVPNNGPVDPEL
jgi:hypothetical protein